MSWAIIGVIVALALFLSGLFSGAETGLYRVNRLRVDLGLQRGDARARWLVPVLDDRQGALAVTLIGTNLMNYVTTVAVAFLFGDVIGMADLDAEIYTVAALTPVVFVFGEVVPKNLFRLYPDMLLLRSSALLALFNRLFRLTGAVWGLKKLVQLIDRLVGAIEPSDAMLAPKWRMAMMLQEAMTSQALGETHSDLVDRVCQLSETPVHRIMVPSNRVVSITAAADRQSLLRVARRVTHARLPVFQRRASYVVGVIKVDDLLRREDWTAVGEAIRPVPTLSPHETVAGAITRLRKEGRGMAIITDHGGRMLGMVTLNDLLQEIVGELGSDD
jgi:CBS domain containing-hemolysin-like protein